jgi:hypothetical protein
MRGFLLVILLLAGYSWPAQAQVCTEIGCRNGLTLTVDPDYKWKWGRYEISLLFEGRSVNCQGYLPLKKCDKGPSFKCSSDMVVIGESGCAMPESTHGIPEIYIDDTPGRMMVRIVRDGQAVITRTLTPEYKESQPNGPGCEPVCNSASYNLLTAD